MYRWMQKFGKPVSSPRREVEQSAEFPQLLELKRMTEEGDILKRPPRFLPRRSAEVRVH